MIKRGAEALLAIGKSIGNLIERAVAFGATLVQGMVKALLELGKALPRFSSRWCRGPGTCSTRWCRRCCNSVGPWSIFDEVLNAGLNLVKEIARAAARAGQALIEFTQYIATAAVDVVRKVLDGLLEAGKLLVDVIRTIATHAVNAIKKVVQAFFDLAGRC